MLLYFFSGFSLYSSETVITAACGRDRAVLSVCSALVLQAEGFD